MMADVPKATVVVTNPTHYAVALRYDRERAREDGARRVVVAKGVDLVAQRIKEVAREAGVVVLRGRARWRARCTRACEIGDEIPEELYQAVAERAGLRLPRPGRAGARLSAAREPMQA